MGWSQPATYHVETARIKPGTLSLREQHTLSDIVAIRLLAFVIIPGKLVTGVCFPQYPVSDRCPHITMLEQGWQGKHMSRKVMHAITKTSPFQELYNELKVYGKNRGDEMIIRGEIQITQEEDGLQQCYFVLVPKPPVIKGKVKVFY
jgi:hypothetical protein